MSHDLVLAGGRLLDPATGLDRVADLGVTGGRIAEIGLELAGAQRLDVRGLLVVPGLVDLHVHVYEGVSHYGIDADEFLLRRGTTTGLDVGSAGAATFDGLRRYVIEPARTRIVALLHIAVEGMISVRVGELEDIRWASVEDCVRVAEANRDVIAGVKLRAGYQMVGPDPRPAVRLARQAADELGLPLMVHVIDMLMPLPELLADLRAGDLVTHCFHGTEGGVLDPSGNVWPEVFEAVERGVVFDIGHGIGSFTFRVARAALAQGLAPTTISSDIHKHNHAGPVFDLPRTMSKLLHLGVPLDQVVAASTSRAAAQLAHVAPGLGTLAIGGGADVSVLELQHGGFPLEDGEHVVEPAESRLVARHVLRDGVHVRCDEPLG